MAEEVGIKDATEEVAENRDEIRPACEEVAKGKGVAEMDDEADEDEPLVAEPGMEVAEGYNRYAQDLEIYDQKESIQVPMEVDIVENEKPAISEEIAGMENRMVDLVRVVPSSLSERNKYLEMLRLFQEEVGELKRRSSKKIEEEKRKEGLGSSGDEDAIIGGIIVEGGASKKAKKKKNKKKRKAKGTEEKEDEFNSLW